MLDVHNPIAAHLGVDGESEMALAAALWPSLQKDWLMIADRLYGVGKGVGTLSPPEEQAGLAVAGAEKLEGPPRRDVARRKRSGHRRRSGNR